MIRVDQSDEGYSGKNHREQSVQLNAHPRLARLRLRNQLDADPRPRDQPSRWQETSQVVSSVFHP